MNIKDLKVSHGSSFHDDRYLIEFAADLLRDSSYFIETGSWHGETSAFVCDNFPLIKTITCEPDSGRFEIAQGALNKFKNATPLNIPSPDIFFQLKNIDPKMSEKVCTFWVDAHGGGFKWPLLTEINIITNNFKKCFILIDDFKNPFVSEMQYDQHENQICSLDYIKSSIVKPENFKVYYPTYTEHTSRFHPLVGWGLITNMPVPSCTYIKEFSL